MRKIRIPIFNGFVEVTRAKCRRLIAEGKVEAFKRQYEPKDPRPTCDVCNMTTPASGPQGGLKKTPF